VASISSLEGGTGAGASATVTVDAPPVITTLTPQYTNIATGETDPVTETVMNPNATNATVEIFGASFPYSGATNPIKAAGNPSLYPDTCPSPPAPVIISGPPTTAIGIGGTFTLAPGASCSFTFTVQGQAAGSTTITGITESTEGLLGNSPTATINVIAPTLPTQTTLDLAGCRVNAISFSTGVDGTVYSFTGSLPPGMTLDSSTGLLSGTPTSYGTVDFTLIATPPNGGTVVRHGYIVSSDLCITPNSGILPNGRTGSAYSFTFGASRGTAPYRYFLKTGGLPLHVTLNQNGVLSGTPTQAGTYNFSVEVEDSSNPVKLGVASFTLTIS
jgi:hypothetical protein